MKNIYEMSEQDIDEFVEKHLPVKKIETDKVTTSAIEGINSGGLMM